MTRTALIDMAVREAMRECYATLADEHFEPGRCAACRRTVAMIVQSRWPKLSRAEENAG
jgi:hypothetical protein